jgi:hypothetical protein
VKGQPLEDLSLYIVKGKEAEKLFFNKTINLCYGMFLKRFPADQGGDRGRQEAFHEYVRPPTRASSRTSTCPS